MEQVALNCYQKERKGSYQLRKYIEKKCELQLSICYYMKADCEVVGHCYLVIW